MFKEITALVCAFFFLLLCFTFIQFRISAATIEKFEELEARLEQYEQTNEEKVLSLVEEIEQNEKHMDNIVFAVVTGEWEKDPRE